MAAANKMQATSELKTNVAPAGIPRPTPGHSIVTGDDSSNKARRGFSFNKWTMVAAFVVVFGGLGSYLLYASHADTTVGNGHITYSEQYEINPDGSGKTALTAAPYKAFSPPVFSPNGQQVAYPSQMNSQQLTSIIVANSDGTNAKTVVSNLALYQGSSYTLSWSHDGQWLAFVVGTVSPTYNTVTYPNVIALVHPDGTGYHQVPGMSFDVYTGLEGVSWMPNSTSLAYTTTDGLCTINTDGTNNACHTLAQSTSRYGYYSPQVSPDGTKVLLWGLKEYTDTTGSSYQWYDVYEANIDGSNLRNLTNMPPVTSATSPEYQAGPGIWSPDGTLIAYGVNSQPLQGLYIMNSDGSNAHRIDSAQQAFNLAWQPIIAGTPVTPPVTPPTTPPTPKDTTPPAVSITSPTNNSPIAKAVTVTATASDNIGVTKVAFYVDGALRSTVTTSPYKFTLDPASFFPGEQHTITAQAYDAAGNIGTSKAVTVNEESRYNPITPYRIADTRTGSGKSYAGKTMGAKQTLQIKVTGVGGVPASGVTAVVLNVTEASATASTYVTLYGGNQLPVTSTLNASAGQTVNNQTTVQLLGNFVNIYNSAGKTDLVVDVVGYYSNTGNGFVPTAPTRITDTRNGSGKTNAGKHLAAGKTLNVQVTGVSGIPATATAVVTDVTTVGATAGSYLSVYPSGITRPTSSSMNFTTATLTKEVTTKLGTNPSGAMTIYNNAGTVDVIVDVVGYYVSGTGGYGFVPLNPTRITDTRTGSGQLNAGKHIASAGSLTIATNSAVPAGAQAVVTNLTVPTAKTGEYLVAYPTGTAVPTATSLTYVPPVGVDESTVKLGTAGSFNLYNSTGGSTDAVVDLLGYYY